MSKIKVAINGYGRIGRNILRALYEGHRKSEIEIVAINDLGDAEINAHLTQYDTTHGKFNGEVSVQGDNLVVNGEFINDSSFGQYNSIEIPEKESYAANCIWVNGSVIIPLGYPKTKQRIHNAGYSVIETDVSEFEKLDGGISCLSLRY